MIQKIKDFIDAHHLLDKEKSYIVALSGGADSVALLRALLVLGYRIEAAHCNFNLRGEESGRDESFVVDLCNRLSVPLHRVHFDTATYAELHKVSIEMAARQLRYRYFEQLRQDIGAEAVCVAHHRDDNVETVLMNMLRGTGIHGMVGIRAMRNDTDKDGSEACKVVRPLLCVSRSDILAWLQSLHQDYVTDSSNLKDDVTRNKIRLNIIPMLQEINPAAVDNIQRMSELMGEVECVYNSYVKERLERLLFNDSIDTQHFHDSIDTQHFHDSIDIQQLMQTASPLSILFEWLTPYGFSAATVRQVFDHLTVQIDKLSMQTDMLSVQSGRIWSSATHDLCVDRGKLLLAPHRETLRTMRLPEAGNYVYTKDMRFRVTIEEEISINTASDCACLDADSVSFPLTVRPVREGDRFVPFGMKGTKLVSDFLTDLKVPLTEKRQQLVVTNPNDEIVWLVGRRPASPYCITPKTKRMLKLSVQ